MAPQPEALNQSAGSAASGAADTILVVEDEASVRHLVTRFLKSCNFQVVSAQDSRDASSGWAERKSEIGLLLTDVMMPGGMNGPALAAHFQTEQPGLKVLFTSAYGAEALGVDGALAASVHFLPKPFRPEQLLSAVRAVLDDTLSPQSESLC